MGPRNLPLMLLAAGVFAAVTLARKAPGVEPDGFVESESRRPPRRIPRRFVLSKDVPSLALRRGECLRVEPDALIRLGDVVALTSEENEVVLTRFHDELMHCVAGLVVREGEPLPAS